MWQCDRNVLYLQTQGTNLQFSTLLQHVDTTELQHNFLLIDQPQYPAVHKYCQSTESKLAVISYISATFNVADM